MRREPKVLSVVQREELNRRHEYLSELERVRYYTLSSDEIALVQKRRNDANRLGFALQLCYLRYPGRALQPQETIPEALLSYVADQLDVPASKFKQYANVTLPVVNIFVKFKESIAIKLLTNRITPTSKLGCAQLRLKPTKRLS